MIEENACGRIDAEMEEGECAEADEGGLDFE